MSAAQRQQIVSQVFTTKGNRALRRRMDETLQLLPEMETYYCEGMGAALSVECSTDEREEFDDARDDQPGFDSDTLSPAHFAAFAEWLRAECGLRVERFGVVELGGGS